MRRRTRKVSLEDGLIKRDKSPKRRRTPATRSELLDFIKLLRRFLARSANRTVKRQKQELQRLAANYRDFIGEAFHYGRLLRARARVGKFPTFSRRRLPDEASELLGESASKQPWRQFYDDDAFIATRGTGGIKEARALLMPDRSVQVELGGDVLPSISAIRSTQRYPDLSHTGQDFSTKLEPAKTRSYGGVPLRDETGNAYQRAHLWGHGFGDEARAGLMYAPAEVNQLLQSRGVERFLREQANLAAENGGNVRLVAKARSHPPAKRPSRLNRKKGEFVLSELVYEIDITRPDGSKFGARVELTVPKPPGTPVGISIFPPDAIAAGP
ncbi:polymorphic toxin type 4 domain-containing protein [Thiosocius teredinicola]|uniref:polymorphic toxin type 4 domain-containing protein n=1 Tax=Thiosocius teredinicola TaxID=1973002 RepID=UPI00099139E7